MAGWGKAPQGHFATSEILNEHPTILDTLGSALLLLKCVHRFRNSWVANRVLIGFGQGLISRHDALYGSRDENKAKESDTGLHQGSNVRVERAERRTAGAPQAR